MPSNSDDDSDSQDASEEEQYPPWLQPIVTGDDYYNKVTVVAEEEDDSQKGHVRCKEIIVPDTADAAGRKALNAIRKCHLKKFSTVLIVSGPMDPPYIGLIDKIWRKADASPVQGTTDQYVTTDFFLECYWFYRPGELPAQCRQFVDHPFVNGARFLLPGDKQLQDEVASQRQLMFSSHHTRHDNHNVNGLLSLEGFLQTCKIHWQDLPERLAIHKGCLVRRREPGFVVKGFLWCNSKLQPQLDMQDMRAFALTGDWGDKLTMKIVKRMRHHYDKEAKKLQSRNQYIRDKFTRFSAQLERGEVADIPSDDGEGFSAQQQQQQQQQQQRPQPPSPVLPGVEAAGGVLRIQQQRQPQTGA